MANLAERTDPTATMTEAAEARLDRMLEAATAAGLEAALITSDESIAYLTGFKPMQLERFFGVVVRPDRSAVIVPALDRGQIDGAPQRLDRISYGAESDGIPELTQALAGAKTVGVEEDHIIYARTSALERHGFEIAPAGTLVMGLRVQKDAAEIERIRAACELVQEGLRRAFEWLTPGVVEQALNARVEAFLREQGATDAHPLILFGENAANPHGNPGPESSDKATSYARTYRPASTATGATSPAAPPSALHPTGPDKTCQVVLDAQQAANAAAQPGAAGRDVDAAQRNIDRGGQRPRRLPARRGPCDRPLDPRAPVPRPPLERPAPRGNGADDRAGPVQGRRRRDPARGRRRRPAGRPGHPLQPASGTGGGGWVIRSVLYLQPRNGNARAVADMYEKSGVLEDAAALDGCLGAELQLPIDEPGPVLVTALWRDPAAYQTWVDSPVRAAHGEELSKLIDAEPGAGQLYEIVIEAT